MNENQNIFEDKLPLPLGVSNWAEFSRDSYCVDKTLFIKELIDRNTRVALFTRPRRFGKTTAMRMVQAFFEKMGEDTAYLFENTKIWAAGEKYRALQGKNPVIYLTFKDHKWSTWESAQKALVEDISAEVGRHMEAISSSWGAEEKCAQLMRIKKQVAPRDELAKALSLLAEALHTYYGTKPIILIDEYDQPITSASMGGYYREMVEFMRVFLSGALKDNDHCQMGLLTGVLRVAKEGIFSGLNNLKVWSVFEHEFSEYFGFTEEEVREMAEYYGVPEKMEEIREWYDGYNFGGREMYNPWSVINYFATSFEPKDYWVDTSSNDLVLELLREYPQDFADTIEALLQGETPWVSMVRDLGLYQDIKENPGSLYALLVSAGYLKALSSVERGLCKVGIPNRELCGVFENEIKNRLRSVSLHGAKRMDQAILERDIKGLQTAIGTFLRESVSYFDTATEGFYHGMTLGFLAVLRDQFRIDSNEESGDGRYDIALTPLNTVYPGFILKVKKAQGEEEDLTALAKEALAQIEKKDYAAKMERDMQALGNTQGIVKMGLAYWKKKVVLVEG